VFFVCFKASPLTTLSFLTYLWYNQRAPRILQYSLSPPSMTPCTPVFRFDAYYLPPHDCLKKKESVQEDRRKVKPKERKGEKVKAVQKAILFPSFSFALSTHQKIPVFLFFCVFTTTHNALVDVSRAFHIIQLFCERHFSSSTPIKTTPKKKGASSFCCMSVWVCLRARTVFGSYLSLLLLLHSTFFLFSLSLVIIILTDSGQHTSVTPVFFPVAVTVGFPRLGHFVSRFKREYTSTQNNKSIKKNSPKRKKIAFLSFLHSVTPFTLSSLSNSVACEKDFTANSNH
jgi:hypothetical protein